MRLVIIFLCTKAHFCDPLGLLWVSRFSPEKALVKRAQTSKCITKTPETKTKPDEVFSPTNHMGVMCQPFWSTDPQGWRSVLLDFLVSGAGWCSHSLLLFVYRKCCPGEPEGERKCSGKSWRSLQGLASHQRYGVVQRKNKSIPLGQQSLVKKKKKKTCKVFKIIPGKCDSWDTGTCPPTLSIHKNLTGTGALNPSCDHVTFLKLQSPWLPLHSLLLCSLITWPHDC